MTINNSTLTQEHLKSIMFYNVETGILTRHKKTVGPQKKNNEAGYIVCSKGGYYKEYLKTSIKSKQYYVHHLIWLYIYGCFPPEEIDHINGNGLDNRLANLRAVTKKDNLKNKKLYSSNSSGVCGVYYTPTGKFRTKIAVDGETIEIGTFNDFFESVCARKSAENKYGFHTNHGAVRPL